MDAFKIASTVRTCYSSLFAHGSIAHLVIDENGLIVWFNTECEDIFKVNFENIRGNSLDIFLPENRRGIWHQNMINGVFQQFKRAREEGLITSPQSMGLNKDGTPRLVQAFDREGHPIAFSLTFAPLIIEEILYVVAFVVSDLDHPLGNLSETLGDEARIVIKNAKFELISQVTDVGGEKFKGIFGFFVNQVWGSSRAGRVASFFSSIFSVGFIAYFIYIMFDSRFGTKPVHQNYNLGEPRYEQPAPSDTDPGLQSPPSPRATDLPKGEGKR